MGYIDHTAVLLSQIVVQWQQLCMPVGNWGSFFLMRTMQGSGFEGRLFWPFTEAKCFSKRRKIYWKYDLS